ncbi:GRB2-associated and regulator of MAPK protein 1 isoform X2 [Astatotilapia calliptera]|uniref:GRB2-associated and regulator of MAPK protein 1 isoform X2 n=1 Tax=Astatotilapia calliptera TaxID=8154 RepID=UPI00064661F6|nr:GRB2-associated and regulator of MAPK protein 1 isoform X2 [Maylandia zebra]XP_026036494.1 GRB2-associated and regulator of MAPK protein 1 isoform X2 [Astatotilapia calliptera]
MDLGSMLYNNLKEVTWSTTSLPLDQLVSNYKLPQIVKLDNGQLVEGLRDNDYLLIHSCRQWTTITAHSLEEGHYVIGPKIEIPVHYEGQFKLLEQDRDVKEPVQYYNSVEEVAKAFPERVYVMEEIIFNVKMASGECNEDTEVYNITLNTGDELTLMGQAEILYAKSFKEKSRFNTIFKKIGKLNSISKIGRGKMPCLICMNHRTNESISLPFQCKGRFSTCSPLELQMQDGEHNIRNIVEKTRLPVNVTVPSTPPRNQYDLHLIREGHRYKLVNIQTKTVVVCCILRSNKIIPIHFPFHIAMPRFIVPEELLQGELWLDTMVHRWFAFCQEQFDIDDYSRAVRDVRTDWNEDGKSPKKSSGNGSCSSGGSGSSSGCPNHMQIPSSLTYARDELTQSFHRLSVCVYGSNLHGNSEVNLQGCMPCGDWALMPSDSHPSEENEHFFPELLDCTNPQPTLNKLDVPYEELWLDHLRSQIPKPSQSEGIRGLNSDCATTAALTNPVTCPLGAITSSDVPLAPPPVPPKSEAVKEECRLLNAPPIPPRGLKQIPSVPVLLKPRQQETRSPSPTLSYYSSGLHNIGTCEQEGTDPQEQSHVCYPCSWANSISTEPKAVSPCSSSPLDGVLSRLSWPNNFSGGDSHCMDEFLPTTCRSYYSYPRKRTPSTPKTCTTSLVDFDGREYAHRSKDFNLPKASLSPFCNKSSSCNSEMYSDKLIDASNTKQSLSCPILPPRTPKSNAIKKCTDVLSESVCDSKPETLYSSLAQHEQGTKEIHSISNTPTVNCPSLSHTTQWQPPSSLAGLSIEEVSKCLKFIGLPDDIVSLFVSEKIDGNLLLQLTEEILSEDFKLSKLQVKKLMQFINGWRPKI